MLAFRCCSCRTLRPFFILSCSSTVKVKSGAIPASPLPPLLSLPSYPLLSFLRVCMYVVVSLPKASEIFGLLSLHVVMACFFVVIPIRLQYDYLCGLFVPEIVSCRQLLGSLNSNGQIWRYRSVGRVGAAERGAHCTEWQHTHTHTQFSHSLQVEQNWSITYASVLLFGYSIPSRALLHSSVLSATRYHLSVRLQPEPLSSYFQVIFHLLSCPADLIIPMQY